MSLKKLLKLKVGDKVVVVGSGGKTTFCLNLCEELKKEKKTVIFTTTTKIFPVDEKYGFIDLTEIFEDKTRKNNRIKKNVEEKTNIENEIEEILENYNFEKKSYLIGIYDEKIKKIKSLKLDLLEKIIEKANYTVIEGDGSKCKALKGWNATEPVYVENTTKSVGIVPINCIGIEINEKNIHRFEKFLEISKSTENERVTVETLKNVIIHENGLFQYSKGEKYLILNCVETEKDFENAKKLGEMLKNESKFEVEIILASLKEKKYFKL